MRNRMSLVVLTLTGLGVVGAAMNAQAQVISVNTGVGTCSHTGSVTMSGGSITFSPALSGACVSSGSGGGDDGGGDDGGGDDGGGGDDLPLPPGDCPALPSNAVAIDLNNASWVTGYGSPTSNIPRMAAGAIGYAAFTMPGAELSNDSGVISAFEANTAQSSMTIAISRCPGDFTAAIASNKCVTSHDRYATLSYAHAGRHSSKLCNLESTGNYYVNVSFKPKGTGTSDCKTSGGCALSVNRSHTSRN